MIKGILFDKDGTLIDFFSLWLNAALHVVPLFLKENKADCSPEMVEYLLQTLGVTDREVDPSGALAYKPYAEIAEEIRDAMWEKGYPMDKYRVQDQIEELFHESVTGRNAAIRELADIKDMAGFLKERHIYMGLATADTMLSARSCLKAMGVLELFDYVGADDGNLRPKPEKDMFVEFQEHFGLKPEEIAVVGDTYNDVVFAKSNGGIAIGVLSGVSGRKDFRDEADYIIDSIRHLPELLDQMDMHARLAHRPRE